jgi:hypothetical protein
MLDKRSVISGLRAHGADSPAIMIGTAYQDLATNVKGMDSHGRI